VCALCLFIIECARAKTTQTANINTKMCTTRTHPPQQAAILHDVLVRGEHNVEFCFLDCRGHKFPHRWGSPIHYFDHRGCPLVKLHHPVGERRQWHDNQERPIVVLRLHQVGHQGYCLDCFPYDQNKHHGILVVRREKRQKTKDERQKENQKYKNSKQTKTKTQKLKNSKTQNQTQKNKKNTPNLIPSRRPRCR